MKRNLLLLLVISTLTITAQKWERISTVNQTELGGAVYFTDKDNGIVGCDKDIYTTTDGGNTWNKRLTENNSVRFNRISMVNSNFGYAIGSTKTFFTENGGETWTSNGTGGKGNDGYFITKNIGLAVGSPVSNFAQIIRRTDNGGTNWSDVNNSNLEKELKGIWFYNSSNGIAVGKSGKVVKTTNAGSTWSEVTTNIAQTMHAVHFPNDEIQTGYIVANGNPANQGYIYKTTNGGNTWAPTGTQYVSAELESVFFITKLVGYVAGQNKIFKTTDGGSTWNAQTTEATSNIKDIFMISETSGFAICDNGDFLSFNDNNSVTEISEELNANIFPNPATDKFFIELTNSGLSKKVNVNIYNYVGKKVFHAESQVHYQQKYEINTEKLPVGIYIIEIIYADRIIRKKLILK